MTREAIGNFWGAMPEVERNQLLDSFDSSDISERVQGYAFRITQRTHASG